MGRLGMRRRREDGVVAVFVAIVSCFTLVPIAAYAVDIGVQRVATRDMQALADVVALDLARQVDGRTYSQLQPQLQTWADASAARNSSIGHGRVVSAELGIVDDSKYTASNPGAIFTPVRSNSDGIPNAVRVTATTFVDFSLHGGSGAASRTAIGRAQAAACFSIGSYALRLDTQKAALLNDLIPKALNPGSASLSAISYTGLVGAKVSLLGLATEMGLGSVNELLALDNVSLNDLYLASAKALTKEGGTVAQVAILNQLAGATFAGSAHIKFSDLVSMDTGTGSALATGVDVLDLVAGSAFLANGNNALSVPSVTAGVPGVGTVTASLHVIQAPILNCGPIGTTQDSSQVTLDLTATLANASLLGTTASSTVTFHVDLAKATGTLTKIVCGSPEGIDVAVSSALSQVSTSLSTDLKSTLLGITTTIAHVTGNAGTAGSGTSTVSIRIPPNTYDQPVSSGSGAVVPQLASGNLTVQLLGAVSLTSASISSAVMSSIVTPTVNPLASNLTTKVVTGLSNALGLEVGGADVFAVQTPTCDRVALVG
jgi:uncharacterized membrane protein